MGAAGPCQMTPGPDPPHQVWERRGRGGCGSGTGGREPGHRREPDLLALCGRGAGPRNSASPSPQAGDPMTPGAAASSRKWPPQCPSRQHGVDSGSVSIPLCGAGCEGDCPIPLSSRSGTFLSADFAEDAAPWSGAENRSRPPRSCWVVEKEGGQVLSATVKLKIIIMKKEWVSYLLILTINRVFMGPFDRGGSHLEKFPSLRARPFRSLSSPVSPASLTARPLPLSSSEHASPWGQGFELRGVELPVRGHRAHGRKDPHSDRDS
nr:uncharacterized protein LOC105495935 isoform X1 [Macaca nemestrina]